MVALTGDAGAHDLGGGYRLSAPRFVGQAEGRLSAVRTGSSRGPEGATPSFDEALAACEITQVFEVQMTGEQRPRGDAPPMATRAASGDDAFVFETPDLGDQVGQVVLAIDENGALTWNFPEPDDAVDGSSTARGAGGPTKRFLIRESTPVTAPTDAGTQRGLLGTIGQRVLKVLVYPLTDSLGEISESYVAKWETAKRPYTVRTFTPANYGSRVGQTLTADEWDALRGNRTLLFVHGTASSTHTAFASLPETTVAALNALYDGRVIAFDHHTLSSTPEQNVFEFVRLMPPDLTLDVDIVSHSRGGLVARTMAGELGAPPPINVGRSIFVATPNDGTVLADPDHMVAFLDRFTTMLNLLPPGPASAVAEVLEAIVTVVKVVGRGLLGGLSGLASMNPTGDFIAKLNAPDDASATNYALAANYEPAGASLVDLVATTIGNAVLDRVFGDRHNDLIVPTEGVHTIGGDPTFSIPDERRFVFDDAGVGHTNFFGHPTTSEKLLAWVGG